MKPSHDLVEALHAAYCEAAGPRFAVALTFDRKSAWRRFIDYGAKCERDKQGGWGVPQLLAVVSYIRRRIKAGRREEESLAFTRLIGSREALCRFEEQLLLARQAHQRTLQRSRPQGTVEIRDVTGTARLVPAADLTGPPPEPIANALTAAKEALGWRAGCK